METRTILLLVMVATVIAQRLLELRVAERNRAHALAQGAQEFGAGHYPLFVVLHTAWLLGWLLEGLGVIATPRTMTFGDALALFEAFVLAQGLRYWAIASLGSAWNTRIIVIPGAERVRRGPYKWVNHPNYIAVVIELLAAPLIFGAWRTALLASAINAVLLLAIRIPAENAVLRMMNDAQHTTQHDQQRDTSPPNLPRS